MSKENLAQGFALYAEEFLGAAKRLFPSPPATEGAARPFLFYPTFYLILHSIELGLKAHLALDGISTKELASGRFGHDLKALVEETTKRGLVDLSVLNSREREAICGETRRYQGKCFEYPKPMYSTYSIGVWEPIARSLLLNIRRKLAQKPAEDRRRQDRPGAPRL